MQRHANAIEIVVFAANVGAHADYIAFVRRDDAKLELLEEAANLGETLAALASDLARERNVAAVGASFNLERWTAFRYMVLALFASQFVLFRAFADGELPQVRLIGVIAYQSLGTLPGYLWGYANRSTALNARAERPAPKAAGPKWMMVEGRVFVVAMLALTILMGRQ